MSTSMMSTVGLELTNFINPDLTWKTASKGSRSGPRRSRRRVARNFEVTVDLANKKTRRVEDTSVADSEKLGVDVLGRRFNENMESVPIKKRKFMFHPHPPSYQGSSHLEDSEQLVDDQHASGHKSSQNSFGMLQHLVTDASGPTKVSHGVSNGGNIGRISEVTNGKCGYNDDFSGIEILAAAACENMDDEMYQHENPVVEKSTLEEIGLSTSEMKLDESVASFKTAASSATNVLREDKIDGSSTQPTVVLQKIPSNKDDRTLEKSVPVRDDRLHWDLNVVMDAWEQPCDMENVDTQTSALIDANKSEELHMLEGSEVKQEYSQHANESKEQSIVDGVDSSDVHVGSHVFSGMELPASMTKGLDKEEQKASSVVGRNDEECVPSLAYNSLESSVDAAADIKPSTCVVGIDACLDHSLSHASNSITCSGASEGYKNAFLTNDIVKQEETNISLNMQLVENICGQSDQLVKHDGEGFVAPSLHVDGDSPPEMVVESCQSIPGSIEVKHDSTAKEVAGDPCSPRSEGSGVSVGEGKHVVNLDVKGLAGEGYLGNTAEVDSQGHVDHEELRHKASGNPAPILGGRGRSISHETCQIYGGGSVMNSDKVGLDDALFDDYDSDVSQDEEQKVGMEETREDQTGYDSQFEDGELRGPDVLCWKEYDGEDIEVERVDYESDNGDTYDSDAAAYSVSGVGKGELGGTCEEKRFCGSEADNTQKKIMVQLPGYCEISEKRTIEVTDGSTIKQQTVDCVDGLDVKGFPNKLAEPRASRQELMLKDSLPLSSGPLHRKDPVFAQRSRSNNFDYLRPQADREAGSDKFMGRDRTDRRRFGRGPGGGHLVNPSTGYWNSKRSRSPTYHYDSRRPGPRSNMESHGHAMAADYKMSEAAGVAEHDSCVRRLPNGVYRPFVRRSPTERDEAYVMDAEMGPVRDISPERRRFRRYPQGVNRGFREDYHRPMPDDSTEYYNGVQRRFARRERSISPFGRVPHYNRSYRKSRSRSRSRSPNAWLGGSRWRSRSPDFRSDGRMERTRFPFQKPSFAADDDVEFVSLPRGRFSIQRDSRWFDGQQNFRANHFRGRRSPARQNQRFDPMRFPRRFNSDDYYRPMMNPGRFSRMGAGREHRKYESSDDERRRNGDRYEMIARVRRYDADGAVRRCRYEEQDGFPEQKSQNYDDSSSTRVTEIRPKDAAPRRLSQEKGPTKCSQEKVLNPSSTSLPAQDA